MDERSDHGLAGTSTGHTSKINWTRCIICQVDKDEPLQCPANSKRRNVGAGYQSFADILPEFQSADALPSHMVVDAAEFDEGNGVSATLAEHGAKWHKTCRLYFYPRELERITARKKQKVNVECEQPTELSFAGSPVKRRSLTATSSQQHTCIFCDKPGTGSERLHEVTTLDDGVDAKVKKCAHELHDSRLLAKLSLASDMVALEAKYHLKCLATLYNRNRAQERKKLSHRDDKNEHIKSLVFAQLVAYIDERRLDDSAVPLFKLCDLVKMYGEQFSQLGGKGAVHSTRLKEELLIHFPDMNAYEEGRDVLLMFDCDVGPTVVKAMHTDWQQDALCLSRAAQIVRKDIFGSKPLFDGKFDIDCQERSVPTTLLALVRMILEGPSISNQTGKQSIPAALELSQLIVYNSVLHCRPQAKSAEKQKQVRHSRKRETPIPLYTGLFLYAKCRKSVILDRMSKLGVCISYERVISLVKDIASTVCETYNKQQVVCPPHLCKNVFTVGAMDNIDHNSSSTTAKGSFHGTAVSLTQHATTESTAPCLSMAVSSSGTRKSPALPEYYTAIDAVMLHSMEPIVTETAGHIHMSDDHVVSTTDDISWLQFLHDLLLNGSDAVTTHVTWSAFHAQRQPQCMKNSSTTALLPLFRDPSNSIAMVKHAMDVIKVAVDHLNNGQTPVMACDQPLYALAKIIQWNFPELYGESSYVIMLGGLHIEMAGLKALGSFLSGSGWAEVFVEAGINTPGTAQSFLSAAHLRRCRHAHEVTAASLYVLQQRAYMSYRKAQSAVGDVLVFDDWCSKQTSEQPQFAYWTLVLQFELAVLSFVRSIRTSNFQLYIDSLRNLAPWFFIMDRTHYARWVSVHIRDMIDLKRRSPKVFVEFSAGRFTVNKTNRPFSAIAVDHAHEQMNAAVKGDGGVIGLTENEAALRRWLIAGPEIARILQQWETGNCELGTAVDTVDMPVHHEMKASVQSSFLKEVKGFIAKVEELGNPFLDDSGTLCGLQTKDVLEPTKAANVCMILQQAKCQYHDFVKERLVDRTVSLFKPIKRNKIAPFALLKTGSCSKTKQCVTGLKNDCVLFSQLYIGCQSRSGNIDEFFEHENQNAPPSLSDGGRLRFASKSDLLQCLEGLSPNSKTKHIPLDGLAVILDGAALVQMLKPGYVKTFSDYAVDVFKPFIESQFRTASRVDLVWDRYDSNSLKATAREHRGIGIRRHVVPAAPIPCNWQAFLRSNENKTELFRFLSGMLANMPLQHGQELVLTVDHDIVTVPCRADTSMLQPCTHEEADTRMILHAADAGRRGLRRIMIRTVDTDVVVLAIANIQNISCDELWLAFGAGKHFRYIPAHGLATSLGRGRSTALPVFHALTGCDTTSSFAGKGKKTAWDTWNAFPEVTRAFVEIYLHRSAVPDSILNLMERFVVKMYDQRSTSCSVNCIRKQLFAQKGRTLQNIPPHT